MPAKYNVIARGNPRDSDAPKKYYPSYVSSGRKTTRDLSEQIAMISTVSSIDMLAAIESLLKTIPNELAAGNIIDLGEFGSFSLRIKSEGSETPEEVTAKNISNVLIQFRPGKAFKQVINDTEFKKA